MANCSNNTWVIRTPTKDSMMRAGCGGQGTCGSTDLGVTDPVNVHELSPRRNREKVREQIKDSVLYMLGAPSVNIELDEQALDAAVDMALQVFEDYAPREYFQYYVFDTVPGQSVYRLPPDVGLVRNVFYKQSGSFGFQSTDLGGAIPVDYFGSGGGMGGMGGIMSPSQPIYGRMGEWVLYKQYEQMYSRLSSNIGGWEWVGGLDAIKLYPIPYGVHKVIVHYLQKQTDWRQVTEAMREGALCYAKIMLGRIRSKIKNPPGPNGGIQLDGDALLQEGREEKKEWEERLLVRYGDLLPIRMG